MPYIITPYTNAFQHTDDRLLSFIKMFCQSYHILHEITISPSEIFNASCNILLPIPIFRFDLSTAYTREYFPEYTLAYSFIHY